MSKIPKYRRQTMLQKVPRVLRPLLRKRGRNHDHCRITTAVPDSGDKGDAERNERFAHADFVGKYDAGLRSQSSQDLAASRVLTVSVCLAHPARFVVEPA